MYGVKMTSRRPWSFRLLALLLMGVVVLGVDCLARNIYLAFRRAPHGRVYHPVYDHGFRPNFSWQDKYGPLETPFFTNSLGFRDAEIRDVPERSDRPRLLIIGDSYAEGVGVRWEDTFAGRLARELGVRGVEVLNAGVMSYTPILEKIKIRYLAEKKNLQFGRVVLFLDLSDIKDELFYGENSEGKAYLIPYGPFASEAGWGTWIENFGEFSENIIEPNFVLLGALSRNLKIHLRKISRKELGKRGAFTTLPDWIRYWEIEKAPEKAIAEQGIAKLQTTLADLASYLRRRGIPMTLVIFPRQEYESVAGSETRVQTLWKRWAEENKVDFLDLFPVFSGSQASRYYIPGDGHWNAEGHALVAQQMIQNYNLVKPVPPRSPMQAPTKPLQSQGTSP